MCKAATLKCVRILAFSHYKVTRIARVYKHTAANMTRNLHAVRACRGFAAQWLERPFRNQKDPAAAGFDNPAGLRCAFFV